MRETPWALHSVSPCLFTTLRSRHVFPKAPCISVLRLRNHTLFFIPLRPFTVCRIPSVGRLPFVTLFFNVLFSEISFSCQKNFDHNRFHLPYSVPRDFTSLTNILQRRYTIERFSGYKNFLPSNSYRKRSERFIKNNLWNEINRVLIFVSGKKCL